MLVPIGSASCMDFKRIPCYPLSQVPSSKDERMRLYGVADFAEGSCKQVTSKETWEKTRPDHAVPGPFPPRIGEPGHERVYAGDSVYAWELSNVRKFDRPVKLARWPAGGVWARWDVDLEDDGT